MLVRLDSYKMEKQFEEYYSKLPTSLILHTSKRNIDLRKTFTAAYIKLLTNQINKGE